VVRLRTGIILQSRIKLADYVPSEKEFVRALGTLKESLRPAQLAMLRAHFLAEGRTATFSELAEAGGYASHHSANLAYGRLGSLLRRELGEAGQFPGQKSHVFGWLRPPESSAAPSWRISMHSNLASALTSLGWFATDSRLTPIGKPDAVAVASEGELTLRLSAHRKRESKLRDAKVSAALAASPTGRLMCEVPGCGFDFEDTYGARGQGFAEVHHLVPLASAEDARETTLEDLAIVCSNCHRMIHRYGDCIPVAEIFPLEA
jgi:hypothetical protein